MTSPQRRIDVNWVQASAGALAAVSSAVLLSTVGVAGTILGAALGSVAVTVGSSVYSHYLRASRDRVAALAEARGRVRRARRDVEGASTGPVEEQRAARERLVEATHELQRIEPEAAAATVARGPDRRRALAGLPWPRLLLAAAGIFVVAMAVIVGFELVTGRALSSWTGGTDDGPRTSVPGLGGRRAPEAPVPSPSPSPAPSGSRSPSATEPAPTPTPTAGTPSSRPTPSATPSTTRSSGPATPSAGTSTPSPSATRSPDAATSPEG